MKKERIFWGLLLVLGSVALIVNKLGYFSHINVFSVLLTVFLLGIMIKSTLRRSFPGILFPLAFISIIFDDQLGITAITPWTVLIAAALGSFGLSMIFYKGPRWHNYKHKHDWKYDDYETINIEDEGHIKLDTSFGGSIKYINSDKFEQADLDCSFGSMKVYFDNTKLNNGRGVVRIDASFSGVELYIPKTWTVENRVNTSFAGVDEKNRNMGNSDNILTIIGSASFAGIEIVYV